MLIDAFCQKEQKILHCLFVGIMMTGWAPAAGSHVVSIDKDVSRLRQKGQDQESAFTVLEEASLLRVYYWIICPNKTDWDI